MRRSTVVEIQLLGGFALRCEGEVVALPMGVQRLLAFLAVRDRPLLRAHIAGVLWLDSPEDRAAANLRSSLWRLRQSQLHLVEVSGAQVQLAPCLRVDVRDAVELAHRILDIGSALPTHPADRTLHTDLLPDWYDEWVLFERERLRQMRLHALEALCEQLVAGGHFAAALEAGLAAVETEPLRESAHRAVIRAHLAEGNICEAIRQYARYRLLLKEGLGVEPSRLIEQLMSGLPVRRANG